MSFFRADTALPFSEFSSSVRKYINPSGTLYYTFGMNRDIDETINGICVGRWVGYNCTIVDPAQILAGMRLIKNDGDWKSGFRRAIEISGEGHTEAMKAIRPGMYELEVQAVFESTFRRLGSPRNGYPCIVGSGPNSCILHYSTNTRQMSDGDVVLMDCAAEYGYYSADITRTVPVSGKFSQHQRELYELVLKAQEAGIQHVRPGVTRSFLDSCITDVLAEGLMGLGFIRDRKDAGLYTLHGYMHWLGLDVHDAGPYMENGRSVTLHPGMVFTVEPGIYVRPEVVEALKDKGYSEGELEEVEKKIEPYLNIGIRIEDDVLVTDDGVETLSAFVPRNPDDIEHLMNGN
jgi:Xaa-Pro aminopeptidase